MASYSPEIINTLTKQVQALTPLRHSYRKLEQYYHDLTHDYNQLIFESDQSEKELLANLKYMEEVHRSLERQFGCCGEQLKQMECEQARQEMEKNQRNSQSEALQKRQLLEVEQRTVLEGKRKEIGDQNQRLSFSIASFKQMIHNLELAIKSKEYENLDLEREIKKMELVNQKITQLNHNAEKAIDSTHHANSSTAEQIYQLECKLGTYNQLIDAKQKQNRQSAQQLIAKTEELEQLRNRKQYIEKLVEAELCEQRDMTKTYGELESILSVKKEKLMFLQQENGEYEKMITEEQAKQMKSQEELLRLKTYLQTLISTNEHLYSELEKSCSQDRNVQVMLSDKLQKLLIMNDKISENEIINSRKITDVETSVFKERNYSPKASPKASSPKNQSLHSRLLQELSSPKAKDNVVEREWTMSREMSTTWGSRSKENRLKIDL